MPLIPLFPLGTVLFPGGTLPLHIFEPRYRLMIGECIEEAQVFGVILIRAGSEAGGGAVPHEVGTTARISNMQRLPDGRMDIVTVGQRRFRVLALHNDRPYLRADVEFVPRRCDSDAATAASATRVAELYAEHYKLALALSDQWTRWVATPSRPATLADFVGSRLEVAPQVKQQLLETDSVLACLEAEIGMLEEATAPLRTRVGAAQRRKYTNFGLMN